MKSVYLAEVVIPPTLAIIPAAVASATPDYPTAATVIAELQTEGYSVQLNGETNGDQLSQCLVTEIDGLAGTEAAGSHINPQAITETAGSRINPEEFDVAYVGISCPPSNN